MEEIKVLNSTFEIALRFLAIMTTCNIPFSEERLRAYSYLSIHISDIDDSKASTHPDLPYRFNHYLASQDIIHPAIHLLLSKGLIECCNTSEGVHFTTNDLGRNCFRLISGNYKVHLSEAIKEVDSILHNKNDKEVLSVIVPNIELWGSEFEDEYRLNAIDYEE